MKTVFPLPLALFLIVLIGCGQAERDRREAAKKNIEELGKVLEQHNATETYFSNHSTRTTMQADTAPDPRREPCPKRNLHLRLALAMRFE